VRNIPGGLAIMSNSTSPSVKLVACSIHTWFLIVDKRMKHDHVATSTSLENASTWELGMPDREGGSDDVVNSAVVSRLLRACQSAFIWLRQGYFRHV